jgi:E3 ubiquitin-protein ligase UBR4
MLEAFGLDLTIIKVEWIPGSQTMIAVGTRQFIRIYDLSEDNISPIKNMILMSNEDEFTDFSISKHQINLT